MKTINSLTTLFFTAITCFSSLHLTGNNLSNNSILESKSDKPVIVDTRTASPTVIVPSCVDGLANGFSVFIFEDASINNGQLKGKLAIGHDASLSNISINTSKSSGNPALVADHDLSFTSGSIKGGDAYYGNDLNISSYGIPDGEVKKGRPINFSTEESKVKTFSNTIKSYNVNGTVTEAYGTITLTGTDPDINVFEYNGSVAGLELNVPTGSTVLINIKGNNLYHGYSGNQNVSNSEANKILFHYYEATSLTIGAQGVKGSIIAPYAHVSFSNGNVHGQLIAKSLSASNMRSDNNSFEGCIANPSTNECSDLAMNFDIDPITCMQTTGSITGSFKEENKSCHLYSLYKYNKNKETLVETKTTPFFNNLPGNKYRIKRTTDTNCNDKLDDKCEQWYPAKENEYFEIDANGCQTISIQSYVWNDLNNNGMMDDGSSQGIESALVILYKDGKEVAHTYTDKNGKYTFTNIEQGMYTIKFELPAQFKFTIKNANQGYNDSQANVENGTTDMIPLQSNQMYSSANAGMVYQALPIQLLNFSAKNTNSGTLLEWTTLSEFNTDRYEIQRSQDGANYNEIETIRSSYYSSKLNKYLYLDENPIGGTTYYRIKQIDKDGVFSFTPVVQVRTDVKVQELKSFPNPFTSSITIQHNINEEGKLMIYSTTGQLVQQQPLNKNTNQLNQLNNLQSGMYYIVIQTNTHQKTMQIIKK